MLYENIKGMCEEQSKAQGSMVEGYTIKEALRFCTKYLQDFIATMQRVRDEKED